MNHIDDPRVRLDREWHRLRSRPAALAAARSWQVTDRHFDDLDGLLTLSGYLVAADARTEAVLRRLVEVGRDDPLAARVVLQRILPGLLAQVRRRRRCGARGDVFHEMVSGAWLAIREFDPRRRPRCVAAALIAGADYLAYGRTERRRTVESATHDALEFDEYPADPRSAPFDELVELVREARADGATDDELAVVRGLVEVGSPGRLAAELGVTPRTIRNRRDRITARMRRVALAA